MSCSVTYNATKGLSLLGDEVGAWMTDTAAETLVGSELVTNGGFATDTDWTKGTGWTIAAGVATHAAGVASNIYQPVTVSAGTSYVVTFTVSGMTAGTIYPRLAGSTAVNGTERTANGTYTETLVANATTTDASMVASSTFDGSIDNVTVRLAVPDLSTANNGLGVHGSIIKSAVATGADLVGYASSSGGYTEQPYNSDIDPTTGSLCIMSWIEPATSANETICDHKTTGDAASSGFLVQYQSDDTLLIQTREGANVSNAYSSAIVLDEWAHFAIVINAAGTQIDWYIDGVLSTSTIVTARDMSNTSAITRWFDSVTAAGEFTGRLALPRIVDTRTAAQIKAIYDKEKILFNEYAMYTQEGESYTLAIAPQGYNPSSNHVRNKSTSLSGVQEVIYLRHDRFWDITTGYTLDTEFDPTRRFIDSVSEGQTFTLAPPDPFVDTHQVVLDSDSYQESRVESSRYFTASFRVKAAP